MATGKKKPVVMETDRGVPNGIATLGEDGKLVKNQRPKVDINEFYAELKARIILDARPVGSYYFSDDPTDPSELFGGTWVQIKDKFILAAGDTYKVGATGGTKEVTIAKENLPAYDMEVVMPGSLGGTEKKIYGNYGGSGTLTAALPTLDTGRATYNSPAYVSTGGSGKALEIMPPHIVAYCWRRTA